MIEVGRTFPRLYNANQIRCITLNHLAKEVIHDLRHSFASILINSGNATLYDVQHLLGHQSPQTSTRYAHLASSRLREVSANVAELVGDVSNT